MNGLDIASSPLDELIGHEWLAVNALGGFASSTVPGLNTRKYHGLLVAAMTPPVHQMVLLSRVEEVVHHKGRSHALATNEYPGTIHPQGYTYLRAFSPEPFPRWGYQGPGWTLEKSLQLIAGENTVLIDYTLLGSAEPIELELRAMFALRGVHELMYQWNGRLHVENLGRTSHRVPATNRTPEVFFTHDGQFQPQPLWYLNSIYRRENERGYSGLEDNWTPGVFRWRLEPGQTVHFACSTDPLDLGRVVSEARRQQESTPKPAVSGLVPDTALQALVRAAGQFVVHTRDRATAVMAGYPWATPNGRDAMIGFAGLLLVPGKLDEAKSLLSAFAGFLDRGLLPGEFPIDASSPRYTSADASLWFINAIYQYLRYGGDEKFVQQKLWDAVDRTLHLYERGTGLGIAADGDGLLASREEGVPTTWMDARVGQWVITPRQGRPVELNALWYNALRIGSMLAGHFNRQVRSVELDRLAARVKTAFNARFWNEADQCCFDVVDDTSRDPSIRPNQLLAVSLPYPVLDVARHAALLTTVEEKLLTPVGLRTLAIDDRHYTGRYEGGLVARDSAHHQGTIFPWMLGPFVTAWLRVHGRSSAIRAQAGRLLEGCIDHLRGAGLGQLCELFDGDPPHRPGGLPASARSVAEVLRCYVEDVLDLAPSAWHNDTPLGAEPAVHPVKIIHT